MRARRFAIPFLFSLASLLQLNYIASLVVSIDQVIRPLMFLWLLVVLCSLPAYWLTGDENWASLLLTIFVIGFFTSPSLSYVLFLLSLIGGVVWLIYLRLTRKGANIAQFTRLMTVIGILIMAYAALMFGDMYRKIPWKRYEQATAGARNYSLPPVSSSTSRPDIYYIVLDGYARSDVLKELFGFDNSDFLTSLQQMGFVVPASSQSNYPTTHLSIASTLNLDYVQDFAPGLDDNTNRWLMAPFIDHSRVRSVLEAQGYQTISIASNWSITDNPTTDLYFQPFPIMISDFEGFLLHGTPLGFLEPVLEPVASIPSAESHRKAIRYTFETLAALPDAKGPKFVFAHIISPHPPFVFDREGNPTDAVYPFTLRDASEYPGTAADYRTGYVEQLQFVNSTLERTIATILAKSDSPPIILLQADHGTGILTDFTSAENTCIRERFSPFAAYYLPGVSNMMVPDDLSNVNVFRLILNQYFGADLPLLENRQYFYEERLPTYSFIDVTERMHDSCGIP